MQDSDGGMLTNEEMQQMLLELKAREASAKEHQKFVCEFIELYREYECLWKYGSKDYRNKNVKNRAYDALVSKMKEVDPRANRNSVMRKINALRTAFRREYKKVRKSMLMAKTTPGQTKKYSPSLWYYDLLKFVYERQDQNVPPPGVALVEWQEDRMEDSYEDGYEEGREHEEEDDNDEVAVRRYYEHSHIPPEPSIKLEPLSSPSSSSRGYSPTQPTATSTSGPQVNLEINSIYSEKDATQEPPMKRPRYELIPTDYDRFGEYVATKLKRSPRKQCIVAEKVIAEVLMRANLGTLQETTTLTEAKTNHDA